MPFPVRGDAVAVWSEALSSFPVWHGGHRGRVLSHWPSGSPRAFSPLSDLDALHGAVCGTRGQVQVGEAWAPLSLLSLGIAHLCLEPEIPFGSPS